MRFKSLDLNLLVALDALLTERSVSNAAKRLFRGQSTISGALAKLREHFQDELLIPSGRKMVLTAFAEGLVVPVHRLIEQIDETVEVGNNFEPSTSFRIFKVAVSDQLIDILMPYVTSSTIDIAPNVVIEIVSTSDNADVMMQNGEIDILIISEAGVSRMFYSELLYEDEHFVVGWNENGMLSENINQTQFFKLGRIAGQFGRNKLMTGAEIQIQRFPNGKNIEVITPSFAAIPRLLIGTRRVAVMHHTLAAFYASYLPLKFVPLPVETRPMRIMLQNHPARDSDAGIDWLKGIIREAVANVRKSRLAIECDPKN